MNNILDNFTELCEFELLNLEYSDLSNWGFCYEDGRESNISKYNKIINGFLFSEYKENQFSEKIEKLSFIKDGLYSIRLSNYFDIYYLKYKKYYE